MSLAHVPAEEVVFHFEHDPATREIDAVERAEEEMDVTLDDPSTHGLRGLYVPLPVGLMYSMRSTLMTTTNPRWCVAHAHASPQRQDSPQCKVY